MRIIVRDEPLIVEEGVVLPNGILQGVKGEIHALEKTRRRFFSDPDEEEFALAREALHIPPEAQEQYNSWGIDALQVTWVWWEVTVCP